MTDLIIAILIVVIVGGAVIYISRAKKKGVRCIGCSSAGNCNCGCCGHETEEKADLEEKDGE